MAPLSLIAGAFARQADRMFLWCPVALGGGIASYFALRFEPSPAMLWAFFALGCGLICVARVPRLTVRLFAALAALFAFGFALAGHRTMSVASPVLEFRYYGPIEGRIVGIDRSASDAVRLTLDEGDQARRF